MKKQIITLILLFFGISIISFSQVDTIFTDFPILKGKYFDESLPGDTPQVFAPFLLNAKIHHIHSTPAFNPEMDEMFFSVYVKNNFPQRIFHSKKIEGFWQKPKLASFSGIYQDGGPKFSLDGETIYFYSRRPDNDGDEELKKARIWFSKKVGDSWNKPQLLSFPEGLGIAFHPGHFASNGIFYFGNEVVSREYEIYTCVIEENKPKQIKRLDEPFSMKGVIEGGAVTDPNNTVLIFDSYDRYGNKQDLLHISKKNDDGTWSDPVLMPEMFNQKHGRFAKFSPDGKYFFFASYRNGFEQIFWIKSDVIHNL